MKILWLSHLIPYPPKGGVLQRSFNLVKEISHGNDVHLLSFVQKSQLEHVYPDLETAYSETKKVLGQYCSKIEYVPIPSELSQHGRKALALKSLFTIDPYTVNWLKSQKMHALIKEFANNNTYDVVHFDTISLIPYLKYFPDTKCVLDHHNIESHMMYRRASEEKNTLKKLYFYQEALKIERVEKSFCKKFALNITCSTLDTDRLLALLPDINVTDIPNGVDTDYYSPDIHAEKQPYSLIFAGGLDWYPNVKAVMFFANEVWPKLKAQIPDVTFNLIGKSPPEQLMQLAKADPNFVIHGFVDEIRGHIDKTWIYICPIDDGGGTKLKVLDALAMSKAIVANPIACEGINVTNGKDVFYASTADEYISTIIRLFNNPDKCIEAGINGRKLIESNYSYHIIGQALRDKYTSLI